LNGMVVIILLLASPASVYFCRSPTARKSPLIGDSGRVITIAASDGCRSWRLGDRGHAAIVIRWARIAREARPGRRESGKKINRSGERLCIRW
jgi:hypothetical protein